MLRSVKINNKHHMWRCSNCHHLINSIMVISGCPNCHTSIQPTEAEIVKVIRSKEKNYNFKCSGKVSCGCFANCSDLFKIKFCPEVNILVKPITV